MFAEGTNDPFEIKFVKLCDRFKTIVGFEFIYTGIEPDLDEIKIDQLLLTIYQKNLKENPDFTKIKDSCPHFDEYLHKEYRIEIVQEYNNMDNFNVYKIKVLEYVVPYKSINLFTERFMGIPIDYESNQFRKPKIEEWPAYLVQYVITLAYNLDSIVCKQKYIKNKFNLHQISSSSSDNLSDSE